jgi:hypothetical protein
MLQWQPKKGIKKTLRFSGYHPCLVSVGPGVQILARKPAILT